MYAIRSYYDNPYSVISKVGDPMIPFVAGMLNSASEINPVLLAGGTQMTSVLAFASKIGFNKKNTAIGTTSYITDDKSANFKNLVSDIADIPAIAVNPHLEDSKFGGLRAFSEGFAKEGVGAGGSIIASMLKTSRITSYNVCYTKLLRIFLLVTVRSSPVTSVFGNLFVISAMSSKASS